MTQIIALLALIVISIGITFGNYWYTYGLWPRSWFAFVCFAVASMLVTSAITKVMKGDD